MSWPSTLAYIAEIFLKYYNIYQNKKVSTMSKTEESFWTRDDMRKWHGGLLIAGLLSGVIGYGGQKYFEQKADEVRGGNQNLHELLSAREEISQQRGITIDVHKVEALQKKIYDLERRPEIKDDWAQYGRYMDVSAEFLIGGMALFGSGVLTGGIGLIKSFPSHYHRRDNKIEGV